MDRDRTTRAGEETSDSRPRADVLMRCGQGAASRVTEAQQPIQSPSSPILWLGHRWERTYHGRVRRHGCTLLQLRGRAVAGARAVGQRGDQADRTEVQLLGWPGILGSLKSPDVQQAQQKAKPPLRG